MIATRYNDESQILIEFDVQAFALTSAVLCTWGPLGTIDVVYTIYGGRRPPYLLKRIDKTGK